MLKAAIILGGVALAVGGYLVVAANCGFRGEEAINSEEEAIQQAFVEVRKSRFGSNIAHVTIDKLRVARGDCCWAVKHGWLIFAEWHVGIKIPGTGGGRLGAHHYRVNLSRCGTALKIS